MFMHENGMVCSSKTWQPPASGLCSSRISQWPYRFVSCNWFPRMKASCSCRTVGSWSLMYSGYIICKNGTYSVVHIRPAVNRVFIDVTCFLNLKEHCLISELSLQLGHLGTGRASSCPHLTLMKLTLSPPSMKSALRVMEFLLAMLSRPESNWVSELAQLQRSINEVL